MSDCSNDGEEFPDYGNFNNYYSFNTVRSRMDVIRPLVISLKSLCDLLDVPNVFEHIDIGCNVGDLTFALNDLLSEITCRRIDTLGIDIDRSLILKAKEKPVHRGVRFECGDIMINSISPSKGTRIVSCFSVTMWIHLHHGDDGLFNFLDRICEEATFLLIEPQSWKSYRRAMRRRRRKGLGNLKGYRNIRVKEIKSAVISHVEHKHGMQLVESDEKRTNWNRSVLFFVKRYG